MAGLFKDRLIFDPADLAESDNMGAYVRAGSDGDLVSSTNVGGKEGLDVNVINASIVVSATDLDIRDLTHVSDSVKIGDGTDFLAVNADGSINVSVISDANDGVFAEDSAHASGDNGVHSLAVVQGTLASSVSADGDYGSFKLDSVGALWTHPTSTIADDAADAENPIKVGSRAVSGALAAVSASVDRANVISDLYRRVYINDSPNIGVASDTFAVDNAAEVALPTTALAGRRRVMIQNLGPNDIYVGPTGLSTADGMRVAKGSTLALEIGENVALFGLSGNATASDVRVFELA